MARRANPIREIHPGYWVCVDGTAEAVRYYKHDTGSWYGWIVRAVDNSSYSDPIYTKEEALAQLRAWGTPR